MQSLDEMQAQMRGIADQLVKVLGVHEREAHAGAACMGNRASAVAYFAHTLGVRSEAWEYAEGLLREYDANCKVVDCLHGITPTPPTKPEAQAPAEPRPAPRGA